MPENRKKQPEDCKLNECICGIQILEKIHTYGMGKSAFIYRKAEALSTDCDLLLVMEFESDAFIAVNDSRFYYD